VAIVSDFLNDTEALLARAAQFAAAGREVHAVHVLHEHELHPPRRVMLVIDPHDPDVRRPVTDATRRRYLASFGEWRERVASSWRAMGAYYSTVSTAESVALAVRRIAR
jgi:hypothetical protein